MKIYPCIIGLGYVGLPLALEIAKKYETVGFDINKKRIKTLKKKIDLNNNLKKENFLNKKIIFTNQLDKKIKAMEIYKSEIKKFPHPRSSKYLKINANRWGGVSGNTAAEAFEIIRKIEK